MQRYEAAQRSRVALPPLQAENFIRLNYAAADGLLQNLSTKLDAHAPVIVCTIVDVETVSHSTVNGKLISAQLSSRLQQRGIKVLQLEARDWRISIGRQGIFFLSTEVEQPKHAHNAQAIVVGTSGDAANAMMVHLEALDGTSVLSSYDYALPRVDSYVAQAVSIPLQNRAIPRDQPEGQ